MQTINNIKSVVDLAKVVETILPIIGSNEIVAFYGEMGVGKTTLIKEICSALGVSEIVSSPTFSLVNEYITADNKRIFHFDFYRINSIEEAYDFGYEDYFFSGDLCLIEWPEKIEELLPDDTLKIFMEKNEEGIRMLKI